MLRSASAAERAQNYPAVATDLNRLVIPVAAMRLSPLPRCSAGYRYWRGMLRDTQGAVSLAALVNGASQPALEQAAVDTAHSRAEARSIARALKERQGSAD